MQLICGELYCVGVEKFYNYSNSNFQIFKFKFSNFQKMKFPPHPTTCQNKSLSHYISGRDCLVFFFQSAGMHLV